MAADWRQRLAVRVVQSDDMKIALAADDAMKPED